MDFLVKLAKIAGYGQPRKVGKDLFNNGKHNAPSKHEEIRKPGKDLFNGGAHVGKPHNPRPRPHLDHGSDDHEWTY